VAAEQQSAGAGQTSAAAGSQPDGAMDQVLHIALDGLSRLAFAQAEAAYSGKEYAQAVGRYKEAVAADPQYVSAHYKLAWTLATCPDRTVRDGKPAVQHAQRACELDNHAHWPYLLALAVAQAEAGDFTSARQQLKEALDKAPPAQQAAYRFLEQRFRSGRAY
jgi:tetratricopeptide (TPR) repeat protein